MQVESVKQVIQKRHIGGDSPDVSANTATPWGMSSLSKVYHKNPDTQGIRGSLRLRKQLLPTRRPVVLLPCLPSSC